MEVPRSSFNQNWRITQENTPTLKVNLKINDNNRWSSDAFCVYSVYNTVFLSLMLSTIMSKLYQNTVISFENGFCACKVAFSFCGLWTADRGADIKMWTAYEILKRMVFDTLMTGNGEFALVFVKLKWFGYLYGGWMFSESVLAGLPSFPSRQISSWSLLIS